MQSGAIILCGGRSSRIGPDKASLAFGNETMLERTVRIAASVVDPHRIVVVAAANQVLPQLHYEPLVVRDCEVFPGPLPALARGFAAMPSGADAVFVTGCDTPLLAPALIKFLFAQLAEYEAVVPEDAERLHPLCAVYNAAVANSVVTHESKSLHRWLDQLMVKRIPVENLREFDPDLHSLHNVNSREDYLAALDAAGLSTP